MYHQMCDCVRPYILFDGPKVQRPVSTSRQGCLVASAMTGRAAPDSASDCTFDECGPCSGLSFALSLSMVFQPAQASASCHWLFHARPSDKIAVYCFALLCGRHAQQTVRGRLQSGTLWVWRSCCKCLHPHQSAWMFA